MNRSDKKLLAAAALVQGAGATICIDPPWHPVTAQDLVLYTKDPEAFYAKRHGLTVEQWRVWVDYRDTGGQCNAITATGKRCKNVNGISVEPRLCLRVPAESGSLPVIMATKIKRPNNGKAAPAIVPANLVQFTSKHPGQTHENDWHFAFYPVRAGVTLCGRPYQYAASGGSREPHIIRTGTPEEATCFDCLDIIEFCQSLPKLEKWKIAARERAASLKNEDAEP